MEKRTIKSPVNSSKPSSQNEKDETALPHKGSKGKGKDEVTQAASNTRTIETTTLSEVRVCEVCGTDLSQTPCDHHERRTKIDIVFEKVVEHIDAEVKICPTCATQAKGRFPVDMPGPLQYGNGLKAYAIHLIVAQMVALNRVQKSIKTLTGETLAEATLLKFVQRLYEALAPWEQSAEKQLLGSPAVHVDETSMRVDKSNYWVHVYSAGDITLKYLHQKRGKAAIEDINIIPLYGGVLIHDCLSSYLSYDHCDHGLCGAHLLRELTFIVDAHDYAWARKMRKLLQGTCKTVSKSKQKKLTGPAYKNLQKRYRTILTQGEKELPAIPEKPKGQRGRIAKSDAHNLWERLKVHEVSVLRFAKDGDVAFTNNRAERDLRMSKVKQKVSGCFRQVEMARAYCRISSYLQSMASKGVNPLIAIQMVLTGEIVAFGGE
jgi:transposase-like protein